MKINGKFWLGVIYLVLAAFWLDSAMDTGKLVFSILTIMDIYLGVEMFIEANGEET